LKLQEFSKNLLGTKLIIKAFSDENLEEVFLNSIKISEEFEENFSRFKEWNFLDKINNFDYSEEKWCEKFFEFDEKFEDFFEMLNFSLFLSKISNWIFDPTVIWFLEEKWYWKIKSKNILENKKIFFGYKNIFLKREFENKNLNNKKFFLKLENWVRIELWAVWKWFLINKIVKIFSEKSEKFLINFWWDIFAKWEWKIALEHPFDPQIAIWEIILKDKFLACSWVWKRVFWDFHHLINMQEKKSVNEISAVFVEWYDWMYTDGFATLLNISWKNYVKNIFEENKNIEWLIIFSDWKYFLSENSKIKIFN